jgi:hypothetical protein
MATDGEPILAYHPAKFWAIGSNRSLEFYSGGWVQGTGTIGVNVPFLATITRGSGVTNMYINDTLCYTGSLDPGILASPLSIGSRSDYPTYPNQFDGWFHDIQIDSRVLSAAEIARKYADPWWRLRPPSTVKRLWILITPVYLTANGTVSVSGTASLSAPALLTAAGTVTTGGTAALSTAASLTAAGTSAVTGTAAITATAQLAAAGVVTVSGSAALGAPVFLVGVGTATVSGTGSLTALAALTAGGTITVGGHATITVGAGVVVVAAPLAFAVPITRSLSFAVPVTRTLSFAVPITRSVSFSVPVVSS